MISIDHNNFLVERKKNQEIVRHHESANLAEFVSIGQFARRTRDATGRLD